MGDVNPQATRRAFLRALGAATLAACGTSDDARDASPDRDAIASDLPDGADAGLDASTLDAPRDAGPEAPPDVPVDADGGLDAPVDLADSRDDGSRDAADRDVPRDAADAADAADVVDAADVADAAVAPLASLPELPVTFPYGVMSGDALRDGGDGRTRPSDVSSPGRGGALLGARRLRGVVGGRVGSLVALRVARAHRGRTTSSW
jgi:hypothetical protein